MNDICPAHPDIRPRLRWQTNANGTRHIIRCECGKCGRFLSWATQTPENMTAAEPETPPDAGPGLFDGIT
jgi:hypothetical protein